MADFELVVVGSGFGSLFFIKQYLERRPEARVAVVEWGKGRDHDWQIAEQRNSDVKAEDTFTQSNAQKPWVCTIGLGGGTNCWWGNATRHLPADFTMRSRYGLLEDWPFTYDDLEPYYAKAETIMSVSGDDAIARIQPRSTPFPLPPHRMSDIDLRMIQAQPDTHFPITTARPPVDLPSRNRCCASGVCNLCPVDAKFSALNGLVDLLEHPGITYILDAEVRRIAHDGNTAHGVIYRDTATNEETRIDGETVVLGANAIQAPAILLRSNITNGPVGLGLCEQVGCRHEIHLDGIDNFGGSTVTTSLSYALYDGDHRSKAAAALLFFENRFMDGLRLDYGRWRQTLPIIAAVEDAVDDRNSVTLGSDGRAHVNFVGVSSYAEAGIERVRTKLADVLAPLPVERIIWRGRRPTEAHMMCSLRGGTSPDRSVVDGAGVHHHLRNLVVVGSATFTTCTPANPSLTVAAMALRSADCYLGYGA